MAGGWSGREDDPLEEEESARALQLYQCVSGNIGCSGGVSEFELVARALYLYFEWALLECCCWLMCVVTLVGLIAGSHLIRRAVNTAAKHSEHPTTTLKGHITRLGANWT